MTIGILKKGDCVINVTSDFIAVERKDGEVDIIPIFKNGETLRVDPGNIVTIGYPSYRIWKDPEQKIIVAESEGMICGFAVLHHIHKQETLFMQKRDFMDIDEFCMDKKYRRQGIASEMIAFIKTYTKEQGINRMELNMWEFNEDALAFYEAVGFKTYRRYMEMML